MNTVVNHRACEKRQANLLVKVYGHFVVRFVNVVRVSVAAVWVHVPQRVVASERIQIRQLRVVLRQSGANRYSGSELVQRSSSGS